MKTIINKPDEIPVKPVDNDSLEVRTPVPSQIEEESTSFFVDETEL